MALKILPVIAAFNVEGTLPMVLDRFPFDSFEEVVVVNDCSVDRTAEVAAGYPVTVIFHAVNSGVGAVIKSGIRYAIEKEFDGVLIMAGNGKDDPQPCDRLLSALELGCDYVQGSRFLSGGEAQRVPRFRQLMIRASALLFQMLTGFKGTDALNGFRAYLLSVFDHPQIDPWQDWLDTYEFEMYLHYKMLKLNFEVQEVPVSKSYAHFEKKQKYSHIRPFIDWWGIVKPILYLHFGLKR